MPVERRKIQGLALSIFLSFLVISLDQLTKGLVSGILSPGDSIPFIKNILYVTLVNNSGAAFGLFKNSTVIFIWISIITIFLIVILLLRSCKVKSFFSRPLFNLGLVLVGAGAIGNLIDRLRFGYVIDFIDVRIWPVFNIADSSITIGTVLLFYSFIRLH